MNYELAKELKDAGFPQYMDGKGEWVLIPSHRANDTRDDIQEQVYAPTLSELIETCGEGFISLSRQGIEWIAEGRTADGSYGRIAHTPEEAVARLWLALNAK